MAAAFAEAPDLSWVDHGEGPDGETGIVAARPQAWGDVSSGMSTARGEYGEGLQSGNHIISFPAIVTYSMTHLAKQNNNLLTAFHVRRERHTDTSGQPPMDG